LPPGFGKKDCVEDVAGGGVVGAVAPVGGSDETDCAEAAAAIPISKLAPRMVDFSKLGMAFLQLSVTSDRNVTP
jgi:hypothetical protein